jgi:hypothetical protein
MKRYPMKRTPLAILLFAIVCATGAASAQVPPPGPPGGGVPPAEALATIPNLTAAQQTEVRRILVQRRDAEEAAQAKARSEFDALRVKQRTEHERIEDQTSEQLRKALGDDGFRAYAEWSLAHRGPPGGGPRGPMPPHGGHRGGPEGDGPPGGPGGHAPPADTDD